jgi:hypothetical protein
MSGHDVERDLTELLDRAAIVDTTHRMARYLDQLDWAALEACFVDEITVSYEYLLDGEPVELTAESFVGWVREAIRGLETTQHFLTNHCVDVDGDSATCTAYCLVQHYFPDASGDCTWTLGGHYDFELVRTEAGWRIGAVEMSALWAEGNRHLVRPVDRPTGSRASDPPATNRDG